MSVIVDKLDSVISTLADLADNPNIDYLNLVVLFGWLQTAFEVFLLYVPSGFTILHSFVIIIADI